MKIIIMALVLSTIVSCSNSLENCKCNEFFTSSNGNRVPYGEASMGFCDGTLANPTPKTISYQKECN